MKAEQQAKACNAIHRAARPAELERKNKMNASQYAKLIGWKSLTEWAVALVVGRANLATMWTAHNIKCKALILGGWDLKNEALA